MTQKPYQGVWEPANMRPWIKERCETDCIEMKASDEIVDGRGRLAGQEWPKL